MTDLEKFLSECERSDKEATPGTWVVADRNSIGDRYIARADEIGNHFILCELTQFLRDDPVGSAQGNANFIVHCRTALPLLVKMLREIIARADMDNILYGGEVEEIAERVLKETPHA